jgi:hypothetical protein
MTLRLSVLEGLRRNLPDSDAATRFRADGRKHRTGERRHTPLFVVEEVDRAFA